MKFYISSAFLNTREIVEVAKAADDLGYDGIGAPDHVVNLETDQGIAAASRWNAVDG